jgi:hypothetical protein
MDIVAAGRLGLGTANRLSELATDTVNIKLDDLLADGYIAW